MAKINIQPDCGNAPRKVFIKELYTALSNGKMEILNNNIQDNITWQVAGQFQVTGKTDYLKAIVTHKLWKVKELTIDAVITHGREASVSGQIKASNNLQYRFCDIYGFAGAGRTAISSITTFLVQEN